jgi:hypothetical protein
MLRLDPGSRSPPDLLRGCSRHVVWMFRSETEASVAWWGAISYSAPYAPLPHRVSRQTLTATSFEESFSIGPEKGELSPERGEARLGQLRVDIDQASVVFIYLPR